MDQQTARETFYKHLSLETYSTESLPLAQALGRVNAHDIFSSINVPPFDRGAMDGFAVKATDTIGAEEGSPVTLKVVGEIKAGYVHNGIVKAGECVEISTGAPMPAGADAVVMIEYCQRNDATVEVSRAVTPSENTMAAGADIQQGERVIAARRVLTSRELAVIAAIGQDKVEVIKRPRIAVFSSGDEILPPGSELLPGKLYDINSTSIITSLLENGGDPEFRGIILDRKEDIADQLSKALDYDLVIISGGTSAGMGDILYEVIDELGEPGLLVHGVQVKPGKPTILAVCNKTPVVGLPGYPASALSILQLFVIPLVRQLASLPPSSSTTVIKALTRQRLRSAEGRYEFKPMYVIQSTQGWLAYPVPGGSGAITSVALADGFIQIPENTHFIAAGSEVEVHLISDQIKPPSIQIIGSHDLALTRAQQGFEQQYPQYSIRSIGVGSSGGVSALRRGEAHIAGIHLLDAEHGYNKWLEEKENVTIIPGFYRMQGFIVKPGNPRKIFGLKDLVAKDVTFMNRNQGSGTRILLDLLLEKMGIDSNQIRGYDQTARSHSSAAETVLNGHVDVTIGIQLAAHQLGLDFIELREEEYDLAVNNEYLQLPAVMHFLNYFHSEEFKQILNELPGYRPKF